MEKDRTVTLKNGTLDVAQGSNVFKMGIQNYCNLTLDNMVVDGTNLSNPLGYGPYTMSNNYGDITINNSTIIAKKGGVAFDVYYGTSDNYKKGVSVTVNNSIITGKIEVTVDKKATLAADAKHQLTLTGGTLTGSLTAEQGAQLYNEGTTVISDVAMAGNTANDKGGAIFNSDDKTGAKGILTLNNVDLKGNNANFGGAIFNTGTLTVNGGSFANNTTNYKGGGAIYNDANSSITFNGTNTFTNNTAAGNANDIYNAGTITVAGGTTTLNSGLVLAAGSTTTVADGALVVNGSTEWADKSATMTLSNGTLTLQKNDVLNGYDKLADQIKEAQLTLTSGSLYLITDQDYTLANLEDAQKVLGIDSKNTFLGFQGGKLVDDLHSDILTVDAETSGVITGGSLVQIGESATTGVNTVLVENDLTIKAGNNSTVTITGNADVKANTVDIETSAAASVVIQGGTGTGSLTVVGNGAGDKLVTSNGDALADITVENGGTFTMGIEGNSQAQGGQVGTVTVNGGTFNITGTAGQQSDYVVNELVLESGLMSVTNASNVHSNSTVFNGGMLFLDPSYKATATNAPVLAILTISEGSTLNLGFMDKATLRQAMLRACLETSAFIVTRRHVDKKRLCAAAKTREDCQTVPQRSDGQRMGACTSSPAPCFWRRSEAQNRPA